MSKKPLDTRPFHLKPFSLNHHRSTMKVGTDSMILGTWTSVQNINSILDIGTGCGIISLLLAARSKAKISAIDIDEDSIEEAAENFKLSLFNERMQAIQSDLNDFSRNSSQQFDLIVSNPPFFLNDLRPEDEKRKKARHTDSLTYNQLCEGVTKLLASDGNFTVVLPYEISRLFIEIANKNGLYQKRQLIIFSKEGMMPNRVNIQFSKKPISEISTEKFTIRNSNGEFTRQYIDLLKDFYLDLGE